jgi:exoribonuclease R
MIAANCAVAERIHATFPRAAILRRHPAPPPDSFTELHALLESVYSSLPPEEVPVLGEAATASNAALAATLAQAAQLLPPQVVTLLKVRSGASARTRERHSVQRLSRGPESGRKRGGKEGIHGW